MEDLNHSGTLLWEANPSPYNVGVAGGGGGNSGGTGGGLRVVQVHQHLHLQEGNGGAGGAHLGPNNGHHPTWIWCTSYVLS